MSSDVKLNSELDELSKDNSNRLYFDMYIYSIASMRNKNRVMKYFNFLAKDNAKNFQKLHTVLSIIERYRAWKNELEYVQDDDSINFDKMTHDISSDLKKSSIVLYQDSDDKSLPITIPMETVDLGYIRYIITKISEWEKVDPFMQDENEKTSLTYH